VPKRKRKPTKKSEATEEVETQPEEEEPIIEKKESIMHGYIATPKIWPDHLTRYERSRIIGARALQISMGAPILVEELEKLGNPVEIAEKELEYGILPLTIRRTLPNGEIIEVSIQQLMAHK
jgi:DNA-directed RNA polymerase subunit K/omega